MQCRKEQSNCKSKIKDPEKKKDLGQAHKAYQSYINKNKKREGLNITYRSTITTKFWQWSILIAVVLITFLINLLDKKKVSKTTFVAETMPDLKPVPIKTKGKISGRYSNVITFNKKLGNN